MAAGIDFSLGVSLMTILESAIAAITLISGFLAVVVIFVQKQFRSPKMAFGLCREVSPGARKLLPRTFRKAPVTTTIYLVDLEKVDYGLFILPFFVRNTSTLPVSHIRLQLDYPEWMYVATDTIDQLHRKAGLHSFCADWGRSAIRLGHTTQVNFELATLRPDESVMLGDMIRLDNRKPPVSEIRDQLIKSRSQLLDLYDSGKLSSYFHVTASLYADNVRRTDSLFEVLALNTLSVANAITWLDDLAKSHTNRDESANRRIWPAHLQNKRKNRARLGILCTPKDTYPVQSVSGRNHLSIHVASEQDWNLTVGLPNWKQH